MPDDNKPMEPRKKRAKIMSACGECRRKKTKCNGEQPCRSCQKSNTACVYPTAAQLDDRKNHGGGPSKAALEAIEDRLKTIEDMLRTILHQSQPPMHDPNCLNNKTSVASSHDSSLVVDEASLHDSNNSNDNRLPSIHNLSASLPLMQQLPNPLGLTRHEEEIYHQYHQPPPHSMYRPIPQHHHDNTLQHPEEASVSERHLQPMKK
ncbi:hypothetical protein CU098_012580, partial [Rhizopus stolonifer]